LLATDDSYLDQVGYTTRDIAGVVSMSSSLEISAAFIDNMMDAVIALGNAVDPNIRLLADSEEKYANGSPTNHIHAGLPPFIIFYAENEFIDALISQAQLMAKRLKKAGVPVELIEVKDRDHFTIGNVDMPGDETMPILYDWMLKTIQNKIET
jgi:acetyl esterase/lipase